MSDKMSSASKLAEELGRQNIKREVGVGLTAISNAVVSGLFPSSWYDDMDTLGRKQGVEVPRSLFRWAHKRVSPKKGQSTKRGYAKKRVQGVGAK